MARFAWKAFEDELFASMHRALVKHARARRPKAVYALGLHGLYAEEGGQISLPGLALATMEGSPAPEGHGLHDTRWSPADWSDPDISYAAHRELSKRVTTEATRGDLARWRRTHERLVDALVAVVIRLRDVAESVLPMTPDFVAAIFDEACTPELVQRSVPAPRFAQLFGAQIHHAAAQDAAQALPVEARAAFLVGRLSRFGDASEINGAEAAQELLALGASSIEALLGILDDEKRGPIAARLLGSIGIPRPPVIAALRERAARHFWFARALGMLGDDAWVIDAPPDVAVHAIAGTIDAEAKRRLDFRPLERLLDARPELRAAVEKRLGPGSGCRDAEKEDVDEALRGLSSAHAVVRWQAAGALGQRELGKRVGARAVPALARLFDDADARVRRLAILSFAAWRPSVGPHRAALERLCDDDDAVVRQTAKRLGRQPPR